MKHQYGTMWFHPQPLSMLTHTSLTSIIETLYIGGGRGLNFPPNLKKGDLTGPRSLQGVAVKEGGDHF